MTRIITLLLAVILDLIFGDPPNRFHPVVLMGNWLARGQRLAPQRRDFWFGAGWVTAGVALFALPGVAMQRALRAKPAWLNVGLLAVLLKFVFAYRNLRRSVDGVAGALSAGDLPRARQLTGRDLVSRETDTLSGQEVAGAAVESLAENITDSFIAPLLAFTMGGLPAAWGYRFVNTADALWGYRTGRFEQLGKFAARLDDALNWLPARLTGWLLVAAAWLAGEDAGQAARVMLKQHNSTPSPNAGWTMSAMAGGLGVTLSKRGTYQLNGGAKPPDAATIHRALRIADFCVAAGLLSLIVFRLILTPNAQPTHRR